MGDEALTAGSVARRLGVAVTTLRTWHQRYGLGPSHHVPGQHRRYTSEDVERLEVMRRLTSQGVTPADAAAWAKRAPVLHAPADLAPLDSPPAPVVDVAWFDVGLTGRENDGPQIDVGFTGRDGGGHTIATGRAGPAARGVARAAMRLDTSALRAILEVAVAERGVIGAWNDVIMPVLIGVGERYAATLRYIEVEHLLSRAVTEVLSAVTRPPGHQVARVLLAAADEEHHTLPLEALAAGLAEHGVPTRILGPRMPPQAMADAVNRTGPDVVVLWSQLTKTGSPDQWVHLLSTRHPPLLAIAAGPGWPAEGLPAGVVRPASLQDAITLIVAAVGPPPAPPTPQASLGPSNPNS